MTHDIKERFEREFCDEFGLLDENKISSVGLLSFISSEVEAVEKAFGGCKKCYGKGYGTSMYGEEGFEDFGGEGYKITPTSHIVFCECERGQQLKSLLSKEKSL